MFCGALSRSVAQTAMQPANVVKTILQQKAQSGELEKLTFKLLTRGAGAQFLLSLPLGAVNFATLEAIKGFTQRTMPNAIGPAFDFLSSTAATTLCSVISTPQMVIVTRLMAGMYPDLVSSVRSISQTEGLRGFYVGWRPNLVQKIPSYGLTWMFFQQFKVLHAKWSQREPSNTANFCLGSAASFATVCITIPLDTAKTRIVTQIAGQGVPYTGVVDCIMRMIKEEGVGALYKALTPRLVSVVPMMGIQFGVYEYLKREILKRSDAQNSPVKQHQEHTLPPLAHPEENFDALHHNLSADADGGMWDDPTFADSSCTLQSSATATRQPFNHPLQLRSRLQR